MKTEALSTIHFEIGEEITSDNGNIFRITRYINTGKNGAVFHVQCVKGKLIGSCYALKVQYNLLEKRLKRFQRELDFLKQQNSQLFLYHCDDGRIERNGQSYPFVVLPYVPFTLDEYVSNVQISYEKKLAFACQLLMALCLLNEQKVVHRDIKPQNILTDGQKVVLADFGLIKHISDHSISSDITEFLNASASMPRHYRTPELVAYANGKTSRFYTESDCFQMGLVLSWLFTDVNPLKSSEDKLADLELGTVPIIDEPSGHVIRSTITSMLENNYHNRLKPIAALQNFLYISLDLAVPTGKHDLYHHRNYNFFNPFPHAKNICAIL